MANQQGTIAPQDLNALLASAQTVIVPVTTTSTTVWTCTSYSSNGKTVYPVLYIVKIEFSTPTATAFSLEGSSTNFVILGSDQNVVTYSSAFNGALSTNPCPVGDSLKLVLSNAPASSFGFALTYFQL